MIAFITLKASSGSLLLAQRPGTRHLRLESNRRLESFRSASSCHDRQYIENAYTTIQRRLFASDKRTKQTKIIPRKAALNLTPKARETFQKLISVTGSEGILLKYEISSQHALRMAFKFDLVKDAKNELTEDDEGVSLELLEDGVTPKPPSLSWNDNIPKLYIHHGAFMKVLGGTIDIDIDKESGELKPKLFDRGGNEMDPNA